MFSAALMVEVMLIQLVSKTTSFVNLAHTPAQHLQGNATMNTLPEEDTWDAQRAVDGDINQLYTHNSCVVTSLQSSPLWWKVWLNRKQNIAYLEIYFRSDTYRRSTGFYIYSYGDESFTPPAGATGSLVYHHDPMSGCPVPIMNITVNRVAQGIALYNERPSGFSSSCSDLDTNQIEVGICEVKIMGCDATRYHPGCTNECPNKCKDYHCDAFNGSCIYGCSSPTAVTTECAECPVNTYALNGRCVDCGHCENGGPCNRTTGRCDNGCANQWIGDTCKLCRQGFYGVDCDQQCGKCKPGTACHNGTGKCPQGCREYWTGNRCDDCRPGFYGVDCDQQCGKCKSGVACHNGTGGCPNGCRENWTGARCDVCRPGFYGSNCNQQCGKCKSGAACRNDTGECPNGCRENWTGARCDVCRLDFYGVDCGQQCGKCKSGTTCHNGTGECPNGCRENWTGARCDVCPGSHYVMNRNCIQCGHCKDNRPCNRTTGRCDNGCKNQWTGDTCKFCRPGFYGGDCSQQCGNCKSGAVCYNSTGDCPQGCQENWTGTRCVVCPVSHYVMNINCIQCGHCKDNRPCNRTTGRCDNGCTNHWVEDTCKFCSPGFYGVDCDQHCGKCKSGTTCHNGTGECPNGCRENWTGARCHVCSPYKYGPNCVFDCGHCKDGRPCSTGNGTCLNGCEDGWRGLSCSTEASQSDRQELSNNDKGSATGLYVAIGVSSTLLTVTLFVVIVLVHIIRKLRQEPSQQSVTSPSPIFENNIGMEETHEYDKIGVRNTDDYQELSSVVGDQPPQERHLSNANYINSS